jgi:hypothetical protein
MAIEPSKQFKEPISNRRARERFAASQSGEDFGPDNPHPLVAEDAENLGGVENMTLEKYKCAYCGSQHNPRANTQGRTSQGATDQRGRLNALIRHVQLNHKDKPNYVVEIRDRVLGRSKEDPVFPSSAVGEDFIEKRFNKVD